jgi:acyl-CoA ligase (AMP-forming) (exosortase A-associated)
LNSLSTTFYELFADNLTIRPHKAFLIDGDKSVTYAQLDTEISALSGYLQAEGIRPGDRVIVNLRKSIAEVAAMFAVSMAGAVIVNVNAQLTAEQFCHIARDCTVKLALVESRMAKALAAMPRPSTLSRVVVRGAVPEQSSFDRWPVGDISINGRVVACLDCELAMIIYTSGSTGKPKGVMLSHRNILAGARSVARYLELGDTDRLLSVLPYSFDYGLNQLTTMLLVGGTIVHQKVTMAAEVIQSANKFFITGLAGVPPLWHQIVRLLEQQETPLPSLRFITNSGGKISPATLERLPDVFPNVDIYSMYGLTEAFRSTYLPPEKFHTKSGSVGQAVPGAQVYIVNRDAGLAGPGESGELVHRGPLVSMGYWGLPEETSRIVRPCPALAAIIGDECVVYSGDTFEIDDDGDLWFAGRSDALIKTSGFRVSPEEIEDLAYRSTMVVDTVAFGVAHESLGEAIQLAVSLRPGFGEDDIVKYCRRSMPAYMIPQKIHLWSGDMPRTASGKLARKEVYNSVIDSAPGKKPAGIDRH